jgi:hypothetical protein
MKIGKILQALGYRGVAGIDYLLLPNEQILFLEINTRFQASTIALNQSLYDAGLPSIHEYHIEAFFHEQPSITKEIKVKYSIISYLNSKKNKSSLIKKDNYQRDMGIIYLSDGFIETDSFDNNIFLYRLLIPSNVSSIFNDKIIHHPNIFSEDIDISANLDLDNLMRLKFGLLVHGVHFLDNCIEKELKKAVASAFDLIIEDKLYVNSYTNTKFSNFSPFSLEQISGNIFALSYNKVFINQIKIDYLDKFAHYKTKNGVTFYSIAQFFTDRLRIHPFASCYYGKIQKACKFCDLGNCLSFREDFSLEDVFEVIRFYEKSSLPIRHFLIGGGTSLKYGSWQRIIQIVKYIRSISDKNIYLMSIPPSSNKTLDELYTAGVTEVGFNIELFNRQYAEEIMPSKGKISLDTYYDAFTYATKLWGKYGAVRSLLLVGIEPIEETLKGVEELCKRGVMPILTLFRPLPNTPMENITPFNYEQIYFLWEKATTICEKYGLELGPKCVPCQNNTISFPSQVF